MLWLGRLCRVQCKLISNAVYSIIYVQKKQSRRFSMNVFQEAMHRTSHAAIEAFRQINFKNSTSVNNGLTVIRIYFRFFAARLTANID